MIVNAFYVMFYQTEVGDPSEDPSHEGDGGGPVVMMCKAAITMTNNIAKLVRVIDGQ